MSSKLSDGAWKLFSEVRQEILQYQRLRTQLVGFKITFLSAGLAAIVAHWPEPGITLLAVPALFAIFFDLLIHSCSFAIKRAGYYCSRHIEPILRNSCEWPDQYLLWEQFMRQSVARSTVAIFGNLGTTVVAVAPVPWVLALGKETTSWASLILALLVLVLLLYDAAYYVLGPRFPDAPAGIA